MSPVLITAPVVPVCSVLELRQHLRIDHSEEDTLLTTLEAGVVGKLDGWRGLLGRGIRPQSWQMEFAGWGDLVLPMPDVTDFTVTGYDAADAVVAPTSATIKNGYAGPIITAEGPAVARVVVDFDIEMPAADLAATKVLVSLMVGNWYENREGNVVGSIVQEHPLAVRSLIDRLRWRVW